LVYRGQLARCLTTVSIGPPSSRMRGESVALVSLVREQAAHFHGDEKWLNNPCYSMRCLMSGVYILWGLSLSLLVLFIFSLLLIMFQNGWKPNLPELTMLRLLWILLDLICVAGLESLEQSLVIKAPIFVTDPCMPCSKSMGSCTKFPHHTTPKLMGRLRFQIGR